MSKKKSKKQTSFPMLPTTETLTDHYRNILKTPVIDYGNPKDIKFMERIFIDHCKETQKAMGISDRNVYEHLDYSKHYLKKKRQTYMSYVKEVGNRFRSKYPDVFVEGRFAILNASALDCYDMYASIFHIDFSVALWILDELRAANKFFEALNYFPEESDVDFTFSSYHDASHDTDVIETLIFLIRNRNSDLQYDEKFFAGKAELELTEKRQYILPDDSENLSYRERFNAIIALIPKEHIEKAVTRFKDKAWEYFDIILEGVNYYRQKEIRLLRRLQRITENLAESHNKSALQPSSIIGSKTLTPLDSLNVGMDRHIQYLKQIDEAADIENEANEYGYLQDEVTMSGSTIKFKIEFCNDKSETDAGKALLDFEVDNPFEACFAALYMLDSGDDFAWLYGLTMGVLQTAIFQLPWGRVAGFAQLLNEEEYNKQIDAASEDKEGDSDDEPEIKQQDQSENNKTPDFIIKEPDDFEIELYKKTYEDSSVFKSFDIDEPRLLCKINLPQIVFEETSVIMPRTSTLISRKTFYEKAGNSDSIYKHYLNLLEASRMRERETLMYPDDEDFEDDEDIQERFVPSVTKENDDFKREKEEFRRKLISSHQERNELKKEIRSLKETNETLEKELKELRAMIRERESYTSEKSDNDANYEPIAFPYEAKHRFVVFGGHASWAKAIKPLLKNVRFVDAYAKPNTSLILNADVVWLQSNAIGHSSYYKIMNLVREHHIPLQYFEAASAEKCAEQLAQYDKSMNT